MNSLLSAIYVLRLLESLRALNFILVEISIVGIYLTHHFGYLTFYIFLNIVLTVFKLDNLRGLDNLLYYEEEKIRFCDFDILILKCYEQTLSILYPSACARYIEFMLKSCIVVRISFGILS